jgi:hypothetical protein
MWKAHSALNASDRRELEQHGVSTSAIERFKLVGVARINRIPDTDWYESCPRTSTIGRHRSPLVGCCRALAKVALALRHEDPFSGDADSTISKMKEPDRLGKRSGSGTDAIPTRGINRCRLAAKTAQPILANRAKFRQEPVQK